MVDLKQRKVLLYSRGLEQAVGIPVEVKHATRGITSISSICMLTGGLQNRTLLPEDVFHKLYIESPEISLILLT